MVTGVAYHYGGVASAFTRVFRPWCHYSLTMAGLAVVWTPVWDVPGRFAGSVSPGRVGGTARTPCATGGR